MANTEHAARRRVAVAPDLGPVRDELARRGYEVADMTHPNPDQSAPGLSAVVVTGLSHNLLGMISMQPNVPILRAEGKSAQEVADEIDAIAGRGPAPSRPGVP